MIYRKIFAFFKRYRGEWIIAIATTAFSILVSTIINKHIKGINPTTLVLITLGLIIVFLLLAILFNLKRLFDIRFSQVNRILIEQFGFYTLDNQYFQRLQHFPLEKIKLAKVFVVKKLPMLIKDIFEKNPNLTKLNVIFDSGTTITPIFKYLRGCDLKFKRENIKIYTNNLAGIDEIHKFDKVYDLPSSLNEEDFNLIGGRPLLKYRATTGKITNDFLDLLKDEQEKSGGKILTLGVLTSNWFIVGREYDNISLCARGKGHFDFKKKVEELSDYVVLISPLGKILPLRDVEQLNKYISGDDKYRAFLISEEKRNNTYLLTTYRPKKTLSPLKNLSRELENIDRNHSAKNYTLFKEIFNPVEGSVDEIREIELPHRYIRDNFSEIYGYEMP